MNIRPIKTKVWIKFLKAHNCSYLRTKASHTLYKCPRCLRDITFRGAKKEIPAIHLITNLKTMGLTLQYLYNWIEEN